MYVSGQKTTMAITLWKGKLIPEVLNLVLSMLLEAEAGKVPLKIVEALVVSIFCRLFAETTAALEWQSSGKIATE